MKFYLPDHLKHCKRGPQIILPKDIGLIIAYSGIDRNSLVVDAGTGSGWLAITLARLVRKVVSYEWREEFVNLAKKNAEVTGVLNNLELKHKDVFNGIDEKEADLITIDMAGAERVIPHAYSSLRKGGTLCGYLPNIEQAKTFYLSCQENNFSELLMLECLLRTYLVRQLGTRPENTGITHTGYLVFAKKPVS